MRVRDGIGLASPYPNPYGLFAAARTARPLALRESAPRPAAAANLVGSGSGWGRVG